MNWSDLSLLMPIGVILLTALVVVFMDLVLTHEDRYVLPWVALTGCILGAVSVYQTQSVLPDAQWFRSFEGSTTRESLILGGAFCLDRFGLFIWLLACMAGALSILASPPHHEDSVPSTGEYFGLTLLAVAGMMLLAVSHDWLTLLISLEIMSISTYILTGSDRENFRSNEAALKYLVLGAFSTAFLLMGMAFYYGAYGSLSLSPDSVFWRALRPHQQHLRGVFLLLSMGFIIVGTLFKVGASPFHFWIPDVYHGAPSGVTGLMAVGVKAAAFAVLARIAFETFGSPYFRNLWIPLLLVIAVLTMVIGNLLAMRQSNLKRLLAYSGIAHTGYLLLAFLVIPRQNDTGMIEEHLRASLFYLLTYGVMTLGAFGVIALVREDGRPMEEIDDYSGLARNHPTIALCMAAFMLSLAGMPPLGGFFAKFLIFRGAIQQGDDSIVIAAIIGILTSVASLYYYLRVVVVMYMTPVSEGGVHVTGETGAPARCQYAWGPHLLIYAAGVVTLAIGLLPNLFY